MKHLVPGKLYKPFEDMSFFVEGKFKPTRLKIDGHNNDIIMFIRMCSDNTWKSHEFGWFLYKGYRGLVFVGKTELACKMKFEKVN